MQQGITETTGAPPPPRPPRENRVYPISPCIVRKSSKLDSRWRGSEPPCPLQFPAGKTMCACPGAAAAAWPASLLRLLEVPQIRRGLIFLGRQQNAVGAQVVVL